LNIGSSHTTHEINFTAPEEYSHTSYTFCTDHVASGRWKLAHGRNSF